MKKTAIALAILVSVSGCSRSLSTDEIIQQVNQAGLQDSRTSIVLLKNGLMEDPKSTELRYLLAQQYNNVGDYVSQTKELERLFRQGYRVKTTAIELLSAQYLSGEYADAIDTAQTIITEHAAKLDTLGLTSVYVYSGIAHYSANDTEGAKAQLALANELTTDNIYTKFGEVYSNVESNEATDKDQLATLGIIAVLDEIINKKPDFVEAILLKGQLYTTIGELEDTVSTMASLLKLAPENNRFKLFYTGALVQNQQFSEAKIYTDELITDIQNNGYLHQMKAAIAYSEKDFTNAKIHSEKAIEFGLYNIASFSLAAFSSIQLEQYEQAKRHLDGIRLEYPVDHPIGYARLLVATKLGYAEAGEALLSAAKLDDIDQSIITASTYHLINAGEYEKAQKLLRKVPENSAQDVAEKRHLLALALNEPTLIDELEKNIAQDNLSRSDQIKNQRLLVLAYYKNAKFADSLALAQTMQNDDIEFSLTMQGLAHLAQNQHRQTIEKFTSLLEENPENVTALEFFADYYYTAYEYTKATEYAQRLVDINPYNVRGLSPLLNATIADKTIDRYLPMFASAFEKNPSLIEYRLMYATALYTLEDFATLDDILNNYVTGPSTPRLYFSLAATAKIAKKDFLSARRIYEKWRQNEPAAVEPFVAELGILELSQDWLNSLQLVESAINKHPRLHAFRVMKANILLQLDRHIQAKNVLALLPQTILDDAKVQALAGKAYFGLEEYDNALTSLHQAYKANNEAELAHLIANTYFRQKDFEEATRFLSAHLAKQPKDIKGKLMLGSYYLKVDAGKAEEVLRAANTELPKNLFVLNNLAYSLYLQEQWDTAEKYGQQALDIAPDNASALDTYGMIKLRQGDVASAVSFLQIAYTQNKFNVPVVLNYAESLLANDQKNLAQQVLNGITVQDNELVQRFTELKTAAES